MIDIESQVYSNVAAALESEFPEIHVESILTFMPEHFPCVQIEEADNSLYRMSMDTAYHEHHAEVMYECNVYSNKQNGAKSECKKILAVIDRTMERMGFVRRGKSPAPANAPMAYRMVGRYSAIVSENEEVYRR